MLGVGNGLFQTAVRRSGESAAPPVITGNPTISGTIRTGQTLTASPASVSGSPTPTRTWQWVRAGVDIAGATAQTYTLTNLDEGRSITVRQTETNGSGSVNATSSATAVPFLLDQLSGTVLAAWSSRQIRTGITALQRIRRSSDNLELDIGPGADGRLDAAALAAHVGANSGFARFQYDQSGNGRTMGNGTVGNQSRIRNAGVNETINSRLTQQFLGNSFNFKSGAWAHDAGGASFFFVTDTASTNQLLFRERNNAGTARYDLDISGSGQLNFSRVNDAGTSTVISATAASAFNGTPRVFALRDSGTLVEGFVNGARFGSGTAYSRTGTLTGFNDNSLGGGTQTNTGITGDMPEFIVMSGAVSDADLNTIIASQGGEYGIAVTPFLVGEDLEFFGRTRDGLFGEFNTNWQGYTATTARGETPNSGTVGFPPLFRRVLSATTGQANRVTTGLDSLNNFNTYGPDLYIGGTCRVYRATNGVMSLVRTSEVTDAKIGRWNWQRFQSLDGQGRLVDDSRVIDGTSYRFTLDTFNRPNVPYWFRVAAVGSNGLSGTWSDPVAYTPTSVTGAANNVANTPRSFNRTGGGGALAAPAGLAVVAGNSPRVASMTWSAVAGAEGYIVEMSYYDPATQIVSAPYLDLASDPTAILPTDLVIFERQFLTLSNNLFSTRVWNAEAVGRLMPGVFWQESEVLKRDGNDWAYVAYSGDKPARAFGDHFIRRTANAGLTAQLQRFWHSGTGQSFYSILAPGTTYRMRVVMRTSVPTTVTLATNSPVVSGTTFSVGTTFAEYTHDMNPTGIASGSDAYDWRLQITAGGTAINLDVAFFEIEVVGASSNFLVATPPPANAYIRDHTFIKFPPKAFTVASLAERTTYGFRAFHEGLVASNAKPWFQLEWNIPREDILNFVAYLAAPNGAHPMATLRQASGIAQPWTTTFANSIKFEPGNEGWNTQGDFWLFPGSMTDAGNATVYSQGNIAGLFWQMVTNWMKESPYWSILAPHLTMHCGGWAVNTWGEDAYRYFPDAKEVSIAAYNGGWDNGTELVAEKGISFNGLLADPLIVQKPRGLARVNALKALCTSLGRNYGTDIRYTIYEA